VTNWGAELAGFAAPPQIVEIFNFGCGNWKAIAKSLKHDMHSRSDKSRFKHS